MGMGQLDLAIRIWCPRWHRSRLLNLRKHNSTPNEPYDSNGKNTRIMNRIRSITDKRFQEYAIYRALLPLL